MNARDTWIYYQFFVGVGTIVIALEGLLIFRELRRIADALMSINFSMWEKKDENK